MRVSETHKCIPESAVMLETGESFANFGPLVVVRSKLPVTCPWSQCISKAQPTVESCDFRRASFCLIFVAIINTPKQPFLSACLAWSVTGAVDAGKEITEIMSPALPRALIPPDSRLDLHHVAHSPGPLGNRFCHDY